MTDMQESHASDAAPRPIVASIEYTLDAPMLFDRDGVTEQHECLTLSAPTARDRKLSRRLTRAAEIATYDAVQRIKAGDNGMRMVRADGDAKFDADEAEYLLSHGSFDMDKAMTMLLMRMGRRGCSLIRFNDGTPVPARALHRLDASNSSAAMKLVKFYVVEFVISDVIRMLEARAKAEMES